MRVASLRMQTEFDRDLSHSFVYQLPVGSPLVRELLLT